MTWGPVNKEMTGKIDYVQGYKLYECADGYWYDDVGHKFMYSALGKLYRQNEKRAWTLIRESQWVSMEAKPSKRYRQDEL